ncbi:MAG TPA: DUF6542 domain-containing protein [Streptosporangiaceae bacterium]|nr:DUF6542 domain-containing protein [Streptosporangiaceae bacterium]
MTEPRRPSARPPHRDEPGPHRGPRGRDRGARGQTHRRQSPDGRAPRRWGALPGGSGVCIVIGTAALGAVATVLTGSEPGFVLGVFVVAGTAAAARAVRPGAVYRIIPVPALAYVAAAAIAGLIGGRATDMSVTALAISAAQWIASGFLAMTAATVLAIVMTAARWPWHRRGPRGPSYRPPAAGTGGPRDPSYRPPAAGTGGPRRPPAARSPSALRRLDGDGDDPATTSPRRRRDAGPGV